MKTIKSKGISETGTGKIEPIGISETVQVPFRRYVVMVDGKPIDILELVSKDTALIIRQSIAQLDKTIQKPKSTKGMSAKWYKTRNNLGKELWKKIEGRIPEKEREEALKIWQWKLHPYAKNKDPDEDIKFLKEKENQKHTKDICGRWYGVFSGGQDIDGFDATTIAGEIYSHLFISELRIDGKPRITGKKAYGLIEHRANSIQKSVHTPGAFFTETFAGDIEKSYGKADLAEAIYGKAKELENNKGRSKRLSMKMVGELMFKHYDDIGLTDDGKENRETLIKLHRVVGKFYKRIVKGSARGQRGKEKLSTRLPQNHCALMKRLQQTGANAEMNTLIREGKIIYYANSKNALFSNNVDEAAAHYRTSPGQAEIKRAESFMRIWRTVKDQAARTVKSWADPQGEFQEVIGQDKEGNDINSDDVLSNSLIKRVTEENYDDKAFKAKAPLLFGSAATVWQDKDGNSNEQLRKDLLYAALKLTSRIRTNLVHFVNRKYFANRLQAIVTVQKDKKEQGWEISDAAQTAIVHLYTQDQTDLLKRIDKDLKGALVHQFIPKEKYSALVALLGGLERSDIPLPRFNRILTRWQNVKDHLSSKEEQEEPADFRSKLPPRATGDLLSSDKAARARFTALKAVYETRFGVWLEKQETKAVETWVDATLSDSKTLAKAPNQGSVFKDLIESKVTRLPQSARTSIDKVFNALSSMVATEIRDQNAYEANPEQARKNSEWVENFKLDLMARAFAIFLDKEKLMYLVEIDGEAQEIDAPEIKDLDESKIDKTPWAANLYYMLHLVPPADIAALSHQFRKTAVLEKKGGTLDGTEHGAGKDTAIKHIQEIIALRQAMHNDKFTGAEGKAADTEFAKTFYEQESDFAGLFPETDDGSAQFGLKRGLRELVRFGHLKRLQTIFEGQKIKSADVEKVLGWETPQDDKPSNIAEWSKQRQDLHDTLVKAKKPQYSDLQTYTNLVQKTGNHRRLSADVRLGTHLSTHHLMMRVFSRLTGFAADWERDRLFVFLGLLMRQKKVDSGSTVLAYQDLHNDLSAKALKGINFFKNDKPKTMLGEGHADWKLLEEHFGGDKPQIRNDFAHYNTLALDKEDIDLTHEMNRMRALMAYDRKRKNSVAKSIRELLEREGFSPLWYVKDHKLVLKGMNTVSIKHVGGRKVNKREIREFRHSLLHKDMVQALFEPAEKTMQRRLSAKKGRKKPNHKNKHRRGKRNRRR